MRQWGLSPRNEMSVLKNISFKLLIICFMVGFGLFFALDVAHKKIPALNTASNQNIIPTAVPRNEQGSSSAIKQDGVLGPMTAATARRQTATAQLRSKQPTGVIDQPVIVLQDSFVNRLSNKIGDIFRRIASVLLHVVVGFFKFILG
jgi:hypothetical protein